MLATKILLGPHETDLWEKFDALARIEPMLGGGVESIVHANRRIERGQRIACPFIDGYEEFHEIDSGFCAHFSESYVTGDWRVTSRCAEPCVRLRIAFAGSARYIASDSEVRDESSRCSFLIRPAGDRLTSDYRGNAYYRYCALDLTQHCALRTLGLERRELPAKLVSHWDRRETVFGHFPLSKAATATARRYFAIKSTGAWRDIQIRAISLELLRQLFDDWRSEPRRTRTAVRITPRERGELLRIRDFIEANPAVPMTFEQLCRKAGLGRNKLHYGFKRMFGVSAHAHRTELRMQAAMKLIESTKLPVSAIALRVGYSEPTNFTVAFKRRFALLPSQVRQTEGDS